MDQNALCLDDGGVDEVEDLGGGLVGCVEKYLILLVKPEICQILHSYRLPVIRNLFSSTIDNVSNLICHNEL